MAALDPAQLVGRPLPPAISNLNLPGQPDPAVDPVVDENIAQNQAGRVTVNRRYASGRQQQYEFFWGDSAVTTYGSITSATWQVWTTGTNSSTVNGRGQYNPADYRGQWNVAPPPPPETEEQRAARVARAAEVERQAQERIAERKRQEAEAESRSLALLAEFLTPLELEAARARKELTVVSQTGVKFVLRGHDVREYNAAGNEVASYCIHPSERLPVYDAMLAKKLLLETDEQAFRKIGNRFPRGEVAPQVRLEPLPPPADVIRQSADDIAQAVTRAALVGV